MLGSIKPYQITIYQGLDKLLKAKAETNIVICVICDVPYRYDSPNFNDDIWYLNSTIKT